MYLKLLYYLALLFVLTLGINTHAQEISEVSYSITPQGDLNLYYTVDGKMTSQDTVIQLRVAYAYPNSYKRKKWLTLKREYFDVVEGEIHARGSIALVNIKNFVETAEVQFELVTEGRVVHQLYFANLLERATEIKPQVFVPSASDKNKVPRSKTESNIEQPGYETYVKVPRKASTAKILRKGHPIRGIQTRRIIQGCPNFENLGFSEQGVAWFYVGVSESGQVVTAIFTLKTTSGEESSITNEEQIKIARLCAKKHRFNRVRKGTGTQYGFIPIYFSN